MQRCTCGTRFTHQVSIKRLSLRPPTFILLSFSALSIRGKSSTMPRTALYVLLLCFLSLCSACYISNCPVGGKRSLIDAPARKCMACGLGNRGRCFGPSICCSAGLGCSVGSPEAASCIEENYIPTPCETEGKACGSEQGRCAAPGVCCNSEGCSSDLSCLADGEADPESYNGPGGDLLMKLLHLTRQHLANRIHQ